LAAIAMAATLLAGSAAAGGDADGSEARPLRVMLIPADGGTDDGTRADFEPLFNAVMRATGLHFDIKTGASYAAVVEGMCSGLADVAWFGPSSYIAARERGCAEFLAVDVTGGRSVYYAGLFVRADSPLETVEDLAGRSLAVGSVQSTSSFIYPMAMLIEAGLDPADDLSAIRITDSHANSLKALQAGLVDAAAASFDSYARAVTQGSIGDAELRLLARSDPIPNPPLALNPGLDPEIKTRLREGLAHVHESEGVTPGMIRGYGGKLVDRYDVENADAALDAAVARMSLVDDDMITAILAKAAEP
jgi:phosphonate transport system substrate-binding protein